VFEIEVMETLKIAQNDYQPLRRSIYFNLEYDAEWSFWIAENEELGIRVSKPSLVETKEELITMLNFMVEYYLIQKTKEKLSEKLIESIENLRKIIDLTKKSDAEIWE